MWYEQDYTLTTNPALQLVNDVISLFNDTLAAIWNVNIFRFFLAFLLFGAAYALCRYMIITVKTEVR